MNLLLLCLLLTGSMFCRAYADGLILYDFQPREPLVRAGRPFTLVAEITNESETSAAVPLMLRVPDTCRLLEGQARLSLRLAPDETKTLVWRVFGRTPGPAVIRLEIGSPVLQSSSVTLELLPPVPKRRLSYIPEPKPAPTSLLIGAHNCPLWDPDQPRMWKQVVYKHPERTPALGFYDQSQPEVADWEIKWAVEHGISFFVYCWYRASQGGPVTTRFSSAIEKALFHSRYEKYFKWAIMWENQARGRAGVSDERDLLENLLPYWINNYFRRDSYLKIDGKPLLFIYRPTDFAQDLGGFDKVPAALEKMREAVRAAGFPGLYILGEYRGTDPAVLRLLQKLGLDYVFAYCWHVPNSPAPEQALQAQMNYIRRVQELDILPQVVTVSQGWSGWHDEGSIWKLPPSDYERLLRQARDFVLSLPRDSLSSRILLLDNWNEWGEGHYIAPHREYGFGYLDAVRRVFSTASEPHEDLLPEDIGLGPYDTAMRQFFAREKMGQRLARRRLTKPGGEAPGLVAWWTFDEADDCPVAYDYTGHRLGGVVYEATRTQGRFGKALRCQGGAVVVPAHPLLSLTEALTIECWIWTDQAGQDNRWIVNRILAGGTDTGYRLGLMAGKPCLAIPLTSWSHHLIGDRPVPLGRWTHLAGVFDGHTMRLYLDGKLCGTMERPGPAKPNNLPLYLGSYEAGHVAHFVGLLDDVRLWSRALTSDEIRQHARARPPRNRDFGGEAISRGSGSNSKRR